MKRVIFAPILLLITTLAAADCPTPSTVGAVICQPSANSTIAGVPHIEANVNPTSGTIIAIRVMIDDREVFSGSGPQVNLFPGGLSNGQHLLQVQAQDDLGRLYGAGEYFIAVGNPVDPCTPSTVGVRICAPAASQFSPQDFMMSLGFKGQSTITFTRAYLDGRDIFDYAPPSGTDHVLTGTFPTGAGTHDLTVVAWDSAGRVYKNSVTFNTFYDGSCPPKGTSGCHPGIFMTTPQDGDDVSSTFRVSGNIQFNPLPITDMKVYLDGVQKGESFGPTLEQQITAAKGTHIMVINAWDTDGKMYKVIENVNVQ